MKCEAAELALSAMFDGGPKRPRELLLHLAACPACRDLFAHMLLLRAICRVAQRQRGGAMREGSRLR
jgi:predicted anti-sigma-YlaC factor YlaD